MSTSAQDFCQMLSDSRRRTLELIEDLSDEQLLGPRLSIVNPPLWEIGHVAWFQERWVLRHAAGRPPIRDDADALYDSAQIAHDTRWDLALLPRRETLDYMHRVLDQVLEETVARPLSDEAAYFRWLALFHEDMHGEAFVYTRHTLGYPSPRMCRDEPDTQGDDSFDGDAEVPGGRFLLGSRPDSGFVFDNEKWAHAVNVAPFQIARTPVTNDQFLRFVQADGYDRRQFWTESGWQWRSDAGAKHPVYWQLGSDGIWRQRRYDQMRPLDPHLPVMHVNWYEADAYCRWAGRRLPTEAEWEAAATMSAATNRNAESNPRYPWGDEPPTESRANLDLLHAGPVAVSLLPAGDTSIGCRQMIGNVWEWTSSDFVPFPGFSADAYKEYSEPWFGTHKVLRGGAFATRARLIRNQYRNFYTPDRRDVLAGFRTCPLQSGASA